MRNMLIRQRADVPPSLGGSSTRNKCDAAVSGAYGKKPGDDPRGLRRLRGLRAYLQEMWDRNSNEEG